MKNDHNTGSNNNNNNHNNNNNNINSLWEVFVAMAWNSLKKLIVLGDDDFLWGEGGQLGILQEWMLILDECVKYLQYIYIEYTYIMHHCMSAWRPNSS